MQLVILKLAVINNKWLCTIQDKLKHKKIEFHRNNFACTVTAQVQIQWTLVYTAKTVYSGFYALHCVPK